MDRALVLTWMESRLMFIQHNQGEFREWVSPLLADLKDPSSGVVARLNILSWDHRNRFQVGYVAQLISPTDLVLAESAEKTLDRAAVVADQSTLEELTTAQQALKDLEDTILKKPSGDPLRRFAPDAPTWFERLLEG